MKSKATLKKPSKVLISLLICFKVPHTTFAKDKDTTTNTKGNQVEYDQSDYRFNKEKNDYVYDPKKKAWVKLQNMEGVHEAQKKTKNDGDKVLHKNEWVYDKEAKMWKKIDIKSVVYDELDEEEDERTFGQNLTVGITAGIGLSFLKNTLLNLGVATLADKLLLVSYDKKKADYHLARWMNDGYMHEKNANTKKHPTHEILDASKANGESFSAQAICIPINIFLDYTAFQRVRFGITLGLEAFKVTSTNLSDKFNKHTKDLEKVKIFDKENISWNMKALINFGAIFVKQPLYDLLLLVKGGMVFDKGAGHLSETKKKENFITGSVIRHGFNLQAGLAWEYHATGYINPIIQIVYDWKKYKDEMESWKKTASGVKLNIHSINLEVGVRVSFGENFLEE